MLFTATGPTAGAILVEWNVHESTQGSAGLWGEVTVSPSMFSSMLTRSLADSHFRVGGAMGTDLQATDCPILSGVSEKCIAASMLMHLTPQSSAYLENVWIWTADHDLDTIDQTMVSVYTGRGILMSRANLALRNSFGA